MRGMRGFGLGNVRRLLLTGAIRGQPSRFQCTSSTNNNNNNSNIKKSVEGGKEASIRDFDVYRQVDNLDFMTAAKILFTTPLKKKKFGIDFHLVQLFFVCMPSLAVYLVAQYARYEIKRMEAEAEVKKKEAEEEEKATEMEKLALEDERRRSDPEFLQVKVRLEALEEAVKGIVVETKKPAGSSSTKDREDQEITKKEEHNTAKTKSASKSEDNSTAVAEHHPSSDSQSSKPDPNAPKGR